MERSSFKIFVFYTEFSVIIKENLLNPCFDQNCEAFQNFDILAKISQCNEAVNQAISEWQTIVDVLQNKFFLELLEVSRSKTSIYLETKNVFNLGL